MKKILIIICLQIIWMGWANAQEESTPDKNFGVKLYYSYLSTGFNTETTGATLSKQTGFDTGAELIYTFKRSDKYLLTASIGISTSKYAGNYATSYTDSSVIRDSDGDDMLITNRISNVSEKQYFNYINIPVKLGIEYQLVSKIAVFANAGISYSINTKSGYETAGQLTRTGYFEKYDLLLEDIDVDGSVYFFPTNKTMTGKGELIKKGNLFAVTTLGLKYNINQSVAISGGFTYYQGFQNINNEDKSSLLYHDTEYKYSLKSALVQGNSYKAKGIGAEIAVRYNF